MPYTITDVKNELIPILHGTTLNQIQNINDMFYRAARKLINEVDPIETVRIVQLTNPIYNNVYDYPCPDDLKDDRIIDIRPQVNRTLRDRFFQLYNEDFDLYKWGNIGQGLWSIQYNTSVKSVRLSKSVIPSVLVNSVSSIVGEGTWVVGGTATNLRINNLNYVNSPSSLEFDTNAGGNPSDAWIENTDSPSEDLTMFYNLGVMFTYVYIPAIAITNGNVNDITLRWGSSTGDYYESTVSTNFFGNAFVTGWNLLKFDWASATVVGTPDPANITYLRVNFNTDGTAVVGYMVNNITSQLGAIYELEYYSKFLFRDAITGAFKERPTSDDDILNLDTTSYNLYFNIVAKFAVQQQKSNTGQYDAAYFENEYQIEKKRYVAKIRSQVIKPQAKYYKMPPKRGSSSRKWIPG